MDDYYLDEGSSGFWSGLPPSIRAAALLAIPFIVADFFNYYSAGTALVISFPLLALMYAACGALACKFAADQGRDSSEFAFLGATAGLALWAVSLVVNTVISLILGTLSLGTTLLLGLPYLCLCAPVQLIGGGLLGALGGFIYGRFFRTGGSSGDGWDYGGF